MAESDLTWTRFDVEVRQAQGGTRAKLKEHLLHIVEKKIDMFPCASSDIAIVGSISTVFFDDFAKRASELGKFIVKKKGQCDPASERGLRVTNIRKCPRGSDDQHASNSGASRSDPSFPSPRIEIPSGFGSDTRSPRRAVPLPADFVAQLEQRVEQRIMGSLAPYFEALNRRLDDMEALLRRKVMRANPVAVEGVGFTDGLLAGAANGRTLENETGASSAFMDINSGRAADGASALTSTEATPSTITTPRPLGKVPKGMRTSDVRLHDVSAPVQNLAQDEFRLDGTV